jgi:hypothetical protein
MKGKLTILIPIVFVVGVTLYIRHRQEPAEPEPVAVPVEEAAPVTEPAATDNFKVDPDRLYDIGYESDPGLIEYAASLSTTPACLIAVIKSQVYGDGIPPLPECTSEPEPLTSPPVSPYEGYSEAELQSLVTTSAEAAVELGRRAETIADAERYFDRAVALSGSAEPLKELLGWHRGGLHWDNGELDVEAAKAGYEIVLLMTRFGDVEESKQAFEEELRKAHVQLGPIQQAAAARYARMALEHQQLTGDTWEGV